MKRLPCVFLSSEEELICLRTDLPATPLEHTQTAALPQDIFSITHTMLFSTETVFRNSCQGPFCLQSRFQRSWVGRRGWMDLTWARSRTADTQPTRDSGSTSLRSPTATAVMLLSLLLCRWVAHPTISCHIPTSLLHQQPHAHLKGRCYH